jgi:cell division protein FtsN
MSAPVAAPSPSSGTMANGEPRRIKTLSVRGDQADPPAAASAPAAAPMTRSIGAAKPGRNPPASANASANTPMSLSPQGAPAAAEGRMASTNTADTGVTPTNGYLVQVSSQRSETDAQTSYRSLQTKFPDVLGQRSPVIKRADLGEKGIYYRAMVGPFGTPDEAVQLCNNLKTAGGQCVVQKK